jgi:hypothetical protein
MSAAYEDQEGKSGTSAAYYAAGIEAFRSTARWLLTAAAGVGGLLVAGLQLSDLGELGGGQWGRLTIAAAAVVVAMSAIAYMIFRASTLLTDDSLTLAQLQVDLFERSLHPEPRTKAEIKTYHMLDDISSKLVVYKDELYGDVADDLADLGSKLKEANRASRADPTLIAAGVPLRLAAHTVIEFVNFHKTRQNFQRLRSDLGRAGAIVVIAVGIYAYAANPPKPSIPPTTIVQLQSQSPTPSASPDHTSATTPSSVPKPTSTP